MSHQAAPVNRAKFWTPGVVVLAVLMAAGAAVIVARFIGGIGYVSNLTTARPWGLWIGVDVASGVALAAGGFTTAFLAHILGRHYYESGGPAGPADRHAGLHLCGAGAAGGYRPVLGHLEAHAALESHLGAVRGGHVCHVLPERAVSSSFCPSWWSGSRAGSTCPGHWPRSIRRWTGCSNWPTKSWTRSCGFSSLPGWCFPACTSPAWGR
jgi:hypothetical protein